MQEDFPAFSLKKTLLVFKPSDHGQVSNKTFEIRAPPWMARCRDV